MDSPQTTWRRRSGAASWRWLLPDPPGGWAPVLDTALDAIGDLGRPTRARVVTRAGGDEAWVGAAATRGERRALLDFVAGAADLQTALVKLDLDALTPSGPLPVPEGGTLALEVVRGADGAPLPGQSSVSIWLDVDLYDPDAARGANAPIARLSAPRLSGFLRRLPRALGGRLVEIESRSTSQPEAEGYVFDEG